MFCFFKALDELQLKIGSAVAILKDDSLWVAQSPTKNKSHLPMDKKKSMLESDRVEYYLNRDDLTYESFVAGLPRCDSVTVTNENHSRDKVPNVSTNQFFFCNFTFFSQNIFSNCILFQMVFIQ